MEENYLVLDIGSGGSPRGCVNIDIPNSRHHRGKDVDPRRVSNFIYADAHNLPFREEPFSKIVCHHVLEHLVNPHQALKEMGRVCNGTVRIIVPSQFNIGDTGSRVHLYTWNHTTLRNLFEKIFKEVKVDYVNRQTLMSPERKIVKIFPFLNGLLSKIGLYSELYAVCKGK